MFPEHVRCRTSMPSRELMPDPSLGSPALNHDRLVRERAQRLPAKVVREALDELGGTVARDDRERGHDVV